MGRVVVLCPTPIGGHVEHALNVALELKSLGHESTVWTRRGAGQYFAQHTIDTSVLDETFELPLSLSSKLAHNPAGRALRVVGETIVLWRRLVTSRPAAIVFEEPKYFLPQVIRRNTRVVTIVHNGEEHDAKSGHPSARGRRALKAYLLARPNTSVLCHSEVVARSVRGEVRHVRATVHPLPADGAVERALPESRTDDTGGNYLLAIGTIRKNKHLLELARLRERVSTIPPLIIAGEPHDSDVAAALQQAVVHMRQVRLDARFLSPAEFRDYLSCACVVVLNYEEFLASSGPLERALSAGVPVVARDTDAVRAQAAGRPGIEFFTADDGTSFVQAVERARAARPLLQTITNGASWLSYAECISKLIEA